MATGARPRPGRRRPALYTSIAALLLLAGCATSATVDPEQIERSRAPTSAMPSAGAVSGVAVGDIACESDEEPTSDTCRHEDTADLAAELDPTFVLALGDLQYDSGDLEEFDASWAPSWGRFDSILVPVPGNHEYRTPDAWGYRAYFGIDPYYSRQIGTWEVYLLDSDCDHIDCERQAAWLTEQLARVTSPCAAAVMHHPRVSSGQHGNTDMVQPLWKAAVEGGVDIALMGHDHDYERFARLGVDGTPVTDAAAPGTREFVVGTGGKSLRPVEAHRPGSEYAQDRQFGVLDLTLDEGEFSWRFVGLDGTVMDEGRDTCRT